MTRYINIYMNLDNVTKSYIVERGSNDFLNAIKKTKKISTTDMISMDLSIFELRYLLSLVRMSARVAS